eukprot:SAG31_NODE_6560_length_1974_cov_2.083733_2_plen_65_part_00
MTEPSTRSRKIVHPMILPLAAKTTAPKCVLSLAQCVFEVSRELRRELFQRRSRQCDGSEELLHP